MAELAPLWIQGEIVEMIGQTSIPADLLLGRSQI